MSFRNHFFAITYVVAFGAIPNLAQQTTKDGIKLENAINKPERPYRPAGFSDPRDNGPHIAKGFGKRDRRLVYVALPGGSAGGHLSLMQGVGGKDGDPKAKDAVDRESSRVQAVACFFPPTDFLNWGEKGKVMLGTHPSVPVGGAFAFYEQDKKTLILVPVTDEEKRKEIGKKLSPIYLADSHSPPTLIVHGDKDPLVPLEQAERMIARLKDAGVPAELDVKVGGDHGKITVEYGLPKIADWFDKYLKKSEK